MWLKRRGWMALAQLLEKGDADLLREMLGCVTQRGELVISNAHEGLQPAVAKVFKATWRCRVHFLRDA